MNKAKTKQPHKSTALALDQQAIAGVDKYFASAGSIMLVGTSFTPATLKAVFQAEIDAVRALESLRAELEQKVLETRKARDYALAMRAALRGHILFAYGPDAVQMVGDFGMTVPKKPGRKTAEAKAEAAVKATATRKARIAALENVVSTGAATASAASSE